MLTSVFLATIFLGSVFALSALICLAHATRTRLGGAPLHALLGALIVLLFVAGKGDPKIATTLLFTGAIKLNTLYFLPPILTVILLTYAFDGTAAARRLFVGIAVLYVVDTLIRFSLAYHATHPPEAWPAITEFRAVLAVSVHTRVASLVAIVADGIVIVVCFQAIRNRLKFVPLFVVLALAFVLAMICDAFVFELLRFGTLHRIPLVEKLEVGVVASLPIAIYVVIQERRGTGIVARGAFDLVDLRARIGELEARYAWVRDSFSKYVSKDVVDHLLADPSKIELGGELREVTVLFADVRGYSTLSEKLDPRETIKILNDYFGLVGELVLEHGGLINEFEGDGILAVFGAPVDLEDHAARAVRCGAAMIAAVDQLNARWREDGTIEHFRAAGLDAIGTRVGIHSGKAVAGNIGTGSRIKYAVIGDTVNTAARVEGLVKTLGESLLFTEATRALLPENFELSLDARGAHPVKGRTQPVEVFTLDVTRGL